MKINLVSLCVFIGVVGALILLPLLSIGCQPTHFDAKFQVLDQLWTDYNLDNRVTFDLKYKGKILQVTGKVSNIGVYDYIDGPVLSLYGSSRSNNISCYGIESSLLATLVKDQVVTVRGTLTDVQGVLVPMAQIENCVLIP
jgi:hypothetical protein